MLLHQGMGLEAYNALPMRRAVVAVYECCPDVPLAADLARARPYPTRHDLFRHADTLLTGLCEPTVDAMLPAYAIGQHWREAADELDAAVTSYLDRFGVDFVMCTADCGVPDILAVLAERLHNDAGTERSVIRSELAKINRQRLERMLGPEGGYDNW